MTTSKDSKPKVAATATSQTAQQTSRQQTPSQSYFSASPSPPPSIPPPPPPVTTANNVPFISRALASESNRREYVKVGLEKLEEQSSAHNNGLPIPALDPSAVRMDDFSQQSSAENPVERFCVWDWVEDPNVVHARTAMAEILQEYKIDTKVDEIDASIDE